jgi:hypothetical protein
VRAWFTGFSNGYDVAAANEHQAAIAEITDNKDSGVHVLHALRAGRPVRLRDDPQARLRRTGRPRAYREGRQHRRPLVARRPANARRTDTRVAVAYVAAQLAHDVGVPATRTSAPFTPLPNVRPR